MDNRRKFLYHQSGVMWGRTRGAQPGVGHPGTKRNSEEGVGKSAPEQKRDGGAFGPQVCGPLCQEKPLNAERLVLVPQSDTGRRVEDTQANGRPLVKEFGKLAP